MGMFVICKARGAPFVCICAFVCGRREVCPGLRVWWFTYHNVGLKHCALLALVLTGRLGGKLSLWGLSLPTQDCRWPMVSTTDSRHPHSALDNTTSFEQQGGLAFRKIILQLEVEDLMPASCICPAEMYLKKYGILANTRALFCCCPSPLTLMRCAKRVLPQKINKVSYYI